MRRFPLAILVFAPLAIACGPTRLAGPVQATDFDETDEDDTDDSVVETYGSDASTTDSSTTDGSTDPGSTDPGSTDPGTTDPGTTTTDPGTSTTDPAACPPGVICVDSFPYTDSNTTTGAPSTLDGYSCAPTIDEGGPEVIYQVELDEPGFLAAALWGLGGSVDVDLHVLESLDAGDCIDRGHWNSGALLMPGTYYVVVDSWVDNSGAAMDGSYSLDLNVTTEDAYAWAGLDAGVLERALFAFDEAWFDGETDSLVYGLIDFTLPSDERRFFIMDLAAGELLFDVHTSHGIGSQDPGDITMADDFSNVSGSNQSSLGMVRAAETYWGSNGYSLKLDGLDGLYNDNVRSRYIVIHSADYAAESFANANGYLGRSQGCPAVDPLISDGLIDLLTIEESLVLSYSDTNNFLTDGRFMPGF